MRKWIVLGVGLWLALVAMVRAELSEVIMPDFEKPLTGSAKCEYKIYAHSLEVKLTQGSIVWHGYSPEERRRMVGICASLVGRVNGKVQFLISGPWVTINKVVASGEELDLASYKLSIPLHDLKKSDLRNTWLAICVTEQETEITNPFVAKSHAAYMKTYLFSEEATGFPVEKEEADSPKSQ